MARSINFEDRTITVPDDATDDEVAALIEQSSAAPTAAQPASTGFSGTLKNIAGGVVEPIAAMGTGMVAKPLSDIAGLGSIVSHLFGITKEDPIDTKNRIQQFLTYAPRTAGGKAVVENVLAPIGGAIDTATGKIASSVTDNEIAQAGIKEALNQGIGFIGVKGAPKLNAALTAANTTKVAKLAASAADQSLTNTIRKAGQDLGLIAPANTPFKKAISDIGNANANISLRNRTIATRAVADDVGLPKGAIGDADIINRSQALGSKYSAVENALGGNVPMTAGFQNDVAALLAPIKKNFDNDPSVFKAYEPVIRDLESQMTTVSKNIPPDVAMAKIKQLRNDARILSKDDANVSSVVIADTKLKLANLYEDMVEAQLTTTGKQAALKEFQNARKQLAQIHLIDGARMTDGLIDPMRLSTLVGKYGSDKRMVSGNIKTIADFGNTFKNVMQPMTKEMLPASLSKFDMGLAGLGGLGLASGTGGSSLLALLPAAAKVVAPILGNKGMLQGGPRATNISAMRQALPLTAEVGLMGTAFSPYAIPYEEKP